MALNIKNSEVHVLASELARLRGVTVTQAVLGALRDELAREKARRAKRDVVSELLEIGKRCAAHISTPGISTDHGEFLYGPDGLPAGNSEEW